MQTAPLRPVPLRPLGTAELLDGAVRLVRGNLSAVLVVSLPIGIAHTLVSAVLQYATDTASSNVTTLAAGGNLLVGDAFGIVLAGLLAPLFSAAVLGIRHPAGRSVRAVGWTAVPLVVLALVVTVAEGAGLVAFVVGGVWLWAVWAVAAPALVLERIGVIRALRRSFRLTRGLFWRTWGVRALGWVLTSVLGLFVTAPFTALAYYVTGTNPFDDTTTITSPGLYVLIVSIGGLVATAVLAPVAAAIDLLIYTDLRMRREGMDIVLGLRPVPVPV